VARWRKTLDEVLRATSDQNADFKDLCKLLDALGFALRVRGDHHIFTRADVLEILNIQPKGTKAKAYQVRQVRDVIVKYKLSGDKDEQS